MLLERLRRLRVTRALSRRLFRRLPARVPPVLLERVQGLRVLVIGVYLSDQSHHAAALAREFAASRRVRVTQRWLALGRDIDPDPHLAGLTTAHITTRVPKFVLLNRELAKVDLSAFDLLVVTDDDIEVQSGFLDAYCALQRHCDLALAQPARTLHSFHDHHITLQRPWCIARLTRFVEIGPVFSVRADAFGLLLPFDERSPMGWGYDHIWPVRIEAAGLSMGIIDRVPVDHSLREQSRTYRAVDEQRAMRRLLDANRHLPKGELMRARAVILRYQGAS